MDRRTFILALGAAALVPLLPQTADAASWIRLGVSRVNGRLDRDVIPVGAGAGTFRQLRVRVRGNDLLLFDLRVRYGNGAEDRLPVRTLIRQGSYTRAIDLRGANRFIRAIAFTYGKLPNRSRPTYVEIYGRR